MDRAWRVAGGRKARRVRTPSDSPDADHSRLARALWRRRGAWLWPVFVCLTVADAIIGHAWPPIGDTQSVFAAALLGAAFNLFGVIVLSWPLSLLLRRVRPDLPKLVARDYAGTALVAAVTAVLLTTGLVHRATVVSHQNALRDAATRAEAWIGAHAPDQFRRNAALINTFTIEAGRLYRSCAPNAQGNRSYCVVVKMWLPSARSVSFAGSESNSVFALGAGQ
jgi:hypothetical protein